MSDEIKDVGMEEALEQLGVFKEENSEENLKEEPIDDKEEGEETQQEEEDDSSEASKETTEDGEDKSSGTDKFRLSESGEVEHIDDDVKLPVPDDDGTVKMVPYKELLGQRMFKKKYDDFVANEKKPLEEMAEKFENIDNTYRMAPVTFLDTLASKRGYTLVLKDRDGQEIDIDDVIEEEAANVPNEELEAERKRASDAEAKAMEAEIRSWRVEALNGPLYKGKVNAEITKEADAFIKENLAWCQKRNPDNPYEAALKLATTEYQANHPKKAASKEKTKDTPRRLPTKPREKGYDTETDDPEMEKYLKKLGVF